MPPKVSVTREMVFQAAFEVARETGNENVNARTVSTRLGCSTHPIMYGFATIEELRNEVYQMAAQSQFNAPKN